MSLNILKALEFRGLELKKETHQRSDYRGGLEDYEVEVIAKDIDLNEINENNPIYVEFKSGTRQGSIAKLVVTEEMYKTLKGHAEKYYYDNCKIKFDDKKDPITITQTNSFNVLYHYTGPTVYLFTKKATVPANEKFHKNKFNQKVTIGSLITGVSGTGSHKVLVVGTVTRITTASVWIEPYGNLGKGGKISRGKSDDIQVNAYETLVLPQDFEEDFKDALFTVVLQA